jgi:two-component system sensor histidine kinase ResE
MGQKKTHRGKAAVPDLNDRPNPTITQQALIYAQDLKQVIRQQRQTQAALDRLRVTFLGTVNHELRTPLALLFQTLEMLEDPRLGDLTEEQLDAVAVLRRQAQTLGRMIESLTGIAAFLSKQETVKPVMARLEVVFNDVLPLAEFKARSKNIMIETDISPNLPSFPLDVKQMEEALTQLLDNAIKFNRSGGKIMISVRLERPWIILIIRDTGLGIEAEQMELIWQTFEQGVDPLRRAQEGLGLGLALARYIISAHRGTIEVKTKLGSGSTFTIKLPQSSA